MKNILIIGGLNKGIGQAITAMFLDDGCKVVAIQNLNTFPDDELKHERLRAIRIDFGDSDELRSAVKDLEGVELDSIVNAELLFEMDKGGVGNIENWKKIFEVNLFGPAFLLSELSANLKNAGSIVNISSIESSFFWGNGLCLLEGLT